MGLGHSLVKPSYDLQTVYGIPWLPGWVTCGHF